MLIKECPARVSVKALDNTQGEGLFTAVVSVFGNKDSVGDVVLPGAFTQTLTDWKASGNPIPVIWSHDWSDPFSHIGYVTDAAETETGLQVTGQLDMDNPKAQQVFRLLKSGRVTQFSFAYDVEQGAFVEDENGSHYELRQLKLYEVGPTLVGANQETELLAVKAAAVAAGFKEGRVLAQKHLDSLKEAHNTLGTVIAAAEKDSPPDDGGKGAPDGASATKSTSRPDDTPDAAAKAAAHGDEHGAAQVDAMALEIAIRRLKGAA
jgi:HK97 family phage prohead protease